MEVWIGSVLLVVVRDNVVALIGVAFSILPPSTFVYLLNVYHCPAQTQKWVKIGNKSHSSP